MQKTIIYLLFLLLFTAAFPAFFGCEEVPAELNGELDNNGNSDIDQNNNLSALLTNAEDALKENRWQEAGEYLDEAQGLPGAGEEPMMIEIERAAEMNVQVIEALKEERIIMEEQMRDGLDELAVNRSLELSLAILDNGSEEIYDLFRTLAVWREGIFLLPLNLAEEFDMGWPNWGLFQEEGVDMLREVSEKFLLEAGIPFYLVDVNLGDTTFYYIIATGYEGFNDLLIMDNSQLIDAAAMGNEVTITLELKEELMIYGDVFKTGEYQIIYYLHIMDDGTFRIEDYRIKRPGSG